MDDIHLGFDDGAERERFVVSKRDIEHVSTGIVRESSITSSGEMHHPLFIVSLDSNGYEQGEKALRGQTVKNN